MRERWHRRSLTLGQPSVVLDVVFRTVFSTILAFALYLHFAGHNQPGGGFIAGLTIGAALTLRFITGRTHIRPRIEVPTEVLLGVGVVLVTGTALVPLLLGNSVLEHHTWSYDVPVLGTVKWTSALFFDTGILLIVVGVVATIIEILGSESDPDLPPVAPPDEDRP